MEQALDEKTALQMKRLSTFSLLAQIPEALFRGEDSKSYQRILSQALHLGPDEILTVLCERLIKPPVQFKSHSGMGHR